MNIIVGNKIELPKSCFELEVNYANRDDSLNVQRFYFKDHKGKQLKEILEILHHYNSPLHENFPKYFTFNNVNERLNKEEFESIITYDKWTSDNYEKYTEGIDSWDEKEKKLDEEYLKAFPERDGIPFIAYDWCTCSGEMEMEIYDFEVYLYDAEGNKFEVKIEW